jgi:uncharacterized protein involved in exopolysaccharide biosynthesis
MNTGETFRGIDSNSVSCSDMAQIILRRKWLILSTACAVAGALAAFALLATPVFTAEAVITIDQQRFGGETQAAAAPPAALTSEINIITSPAFVARIADEFNLREDPEFNGKQANRLVQRMEQLAATIPSWLQSRISPYPKVVNGHGDDVNPSLHRMITTVTKHLDVSNDGRSFTIRIRFSTSDPNKASILANAFAEEYIESQVEFKKKQSAEINAWLEERVAELRNRVLKADKAAEEMRQHFKIVQPGGADTLEDQKLVQLNGQLIAARADRLKAEARLMTARKLLHSPDKTSATGDVLGSPLIQRLREQESALKAQYASLSSQFGPSHPRMMAIETEIAGMSQTINNEIRKVIDSIANDVSIARANEDVLVNGLKNAEASFGEMKRAQIQVRELERQADSQRNLYEQFLNHYNQTIERNYFAQSDARMISPAMPPSGPVYPKIELFAGFGLLLGTFLGILVAFIAERWERTFKTTRTIEDVTGVAAIGLVPISRAGRARHTTRHVVDAIYDESVARVQAVLDYSRPGTRPKIIAVTSALPKEGKSTFCAAIGRAAALSGRRVLAVELDFRCPSFWQMFDIEPGSGDLIDMVEGTKELDQVVRRDAGSGLEFIPILNRVEYPRDVIGSNSMKGLFHRLCSSYDLIIVDTPPIMAVAGTAALSEIIDTCLFVVKWGKTPRDAVVAGLRQMSLFKLPVAGIVLAQVDPKQLGMGSDAHYYKSVSQYSSCRNSC